MSLGLSEGPAYPAPILPELDAVTCPKCQGTKFHESISPLGVDHSTRCTTCYGAGEVEVCDNCRQVPTVRQGFDFCGCVAVTELGQVA